MKATDYLGNEINVGDEVIITQPQYRNFIRAKVDKITPKFCFLTYHYQNYDHTCKQEHSQVIVVGGLKK